MTLRKETVGACELWLGDCREILPTLARDLAVVSDPPYGINHRLGAGITKPKIVGSKLQRTAAATNNLIAPIIGDDKPFDPMPLLEFRELILWGADHYAAKLPHGRWLAWNKLGDLEPYDQFSDVEFAWHSERGAGRIFSLLWKGAIKGSEKMGASKPWHDRRERWHPTQKPVALMCWCIELLQGSAGTILDPYMGSGTTLVACVKLGRRGIGIEVEPRYFDVACRRVEAATKQPDLFVEQPKSTEQLDLLGAYNAR